MSQHSVQVTKSCLLRCMVGQEPTEFDATRGQVLANITELLVRQLEQKWAMSQARNSSVQLMRSLACYDEAFLFLDTSRQGDWRVLHMNKAASKLLGKRGSSRRASEHVGGGGGSATASIDGHVLDQSGIKIKWGEPKGLEGDRWGEGVGAVSGDTSTEAEQCCTSATPLYRNWSWPGFVCLE